MKHLPLLAAPLTLLTACSLSVEVESTSDEAEPASTVAAAEVSIGAGRWEAEQVFDEGDSNLETVTTVDGRRSGTWRLQFGEGIESVTYGFIGIGGKSRTSTTELLGRTELDLTMELEDVDAEELLKALEGLGADEEKSIELEASLRATAGVRATLTASSDSPSSSGTTTSTGMLPGATVDAAVWEGQQPPGHRQRRRGPGRGGDPRLGALGRDRWIPDLAGGPPCRRPGRREPVRSHLQARRRAPGPSGRAPLRRGCSSWSPTDRSGGKPRPPGAFLRIRCPGFAGRCMWV